MSEPGEGITEEPKSPRWPAIAIGVAWVVLTPFLMGVTAAAVTAAELVTGKGVVNGNPVISGAIEALVYLIVSFGVFGMARRLGVPRLFWIAGPAGYVLGAIGTVGLWWLVGGAATVGPRWLIAATVNTAACAIGAYVGARGGARRTETGSSQS